MDKRIEFLRKEKLSLSQEEFGEKIGVSKATISKIENGSSTLTDRNIKAICREFKVSYAWIVEGLGDIFTNLPETMLDELADEYKLDDIEKNIVKSFLNLSKEERSVIIKYFKSALDK